MSTKKQELFTMCTKELDETQMLVAVMACGMCRAVAEGAVRPEYACRQLFNPALLFRLKDLNADPQLIDAIHSAAALEVLAEPALEWPNLACDPQTFRDRT